MGFGFVVEVFRYEPMLDELAVGFLIAHDDRTRIDFDHFSLNTKRIDKHVIAGAKFHESLSLAFECVAQLDDVIEDRAERPAIEVG
jgi:hypothetical protein